MISETTFKNRSSRMTDLNDVSFGFGANNDFVADRLAALYRLVHFAHFFFPYLRMPASSLASMR